MRDICMKDCSYQMSKLLCFQYILKGKWKLSNSLYILEHLYSAKLCVSERWLEQMLSAVSLNTCIVQDE